MPQQVTDIDLLRDYLRGVVNRADHHAQNVNEIALAIVGAIIWRKNDDPLEVMARDGEMKNVLWVKISNRRYALSYNHDNEQIEMREGTTQGNVIGSFSNDTSLNVVRELFMRL